VRGIFLILALTIPNPLPFRKPLSIENFVGNWLSNMTDTVRTLHSTQLKMHPCIPKAAYYFRPYSMVLAWYYEVRCCLYISSLLSWFGSLAFHVTLRIERHDRSLHFNSRLQHIRTHSFEVYIQCGLMLWKECYCAQQLSLDGCTASSFGKGWHLDSHLTIAIVMCG
jgi:hypothetical protein